jgi:hypothetical protein
MRHSCAAKDAILALADDYDARSHRCANHRCTCVRYEVSPMFRTPQCKSDSVNLIYLFSRARWPSSADAKKKARGAAPPVVEVVDVTQKDVPIARKWVATLTGPDSCTGRGLFDEADLCQRRLSEERGASFSIGFLHIPG